MTMKTNKAIIIGIGNECPKCKDPMDRRSHPNHWKPKKSYFYTKWDMCKKCKHIQHYEEFKSDTWKENERREDFLRKI